MASIVLGMGTPHSPQLSTPPELWAEHARRDMNNPALHAPDGKVYTYGQLLDMADPALEKELTPAKFTARYDACQQAIAGLSSAFAAANLDALIIMGNDQQEQFHDDNMPALAAYWGETIKEPASRPGRKRPGQPQGVRMGLGRRLRNRLPGAASPVLAHHRVADGGAVRCGAHPAPAGGNGHGPRLRLRLSADNGPATNPIPQPVPAGER